MNDLPVKALFYGEAGIGKTVLLCSGAADPRIGPELLLNLESGLLSVQSKVETVGEGKDTFTLEEVMTPPEKGKVKAVKITNPDQLMRVLDGLYDMPHEYKTVMIDSLTELNYNNLSDVVLNNTKNIDHDIPTIQDYGKSAAQMRRIIRYFRDLPMNVIFSALVQTNKNELTGEITNLPSLTGKLSLEVPALLDIVGYMTMKKIEGEFHRVLWFQPYDNAIAKDRSEGGKLGDFMEDPTLPKIFDSLGYAMPPVAPALPDTTKTTKESKK